MIAEMKTIGIKTFKKKGKLPLLAIPPKTKSTPEPANRSSASNTPDKPLTIVVPAVVRNKINPNKNCKTSIIKIGEYRIFFRSLLMTKLNAKIRIKPIIPIKRKKSLLVHNNILIHLQTSKMNSMFTHISFCSLPKLES